MTYSGDSREPQSSIPQYAPDDAIDLRDLFARLMRGLPQIFGLALIGMALCGIGYLIYSPFQSVSTTTRVVFSFPGFEKNQYPDKSKFQADDLRAPDNIAEAIKRRNLDSSPEFQSKLRAAVSIEGIIPPNVVKDRDRTRASGQTPPVYIPDEYTVTLTLPRSFPLDKSQRSMFLNELISVYRENFRKTYADTPLSFGNAFEVLKDADYPDYENIFDREMRSISLYLTERINEAKLFRSKTTNMSFSDLQKQAQLLSQIYLNETLGLIIQNGLTHNRRISLIKMKDEMRLLTDAEQRAADEENVVKDLLADAQKREQNYVLGVKNQAAQPSGNAPILDQNVINSLLANDSYSFLVRRALEASLKVRQVQADKNLLQQRIDNLKSFANESAVDQTALIAELERSIARLEKGYNSLIENIKKTHTDYSNQMFGDAVQLSDSITNASTIRPIAMPAIVGAFLGFALGAGLSLLGVYVGRKTTAATSAAA